MLSKSWVFLGLLGLAAAVPQEPTAASSSQTLPPSPTGSGACEPHGDHWHCNAAATASPASHSDEAVASCEPHGDHWHCPSGVPKPTAPPQGVSHDDGDHEDDIGGEHDGEAQPSCVPHNDHWHCPSGVAKPTTPPPSASSAAATPKSQVASASSSSANASSSGSVGGRDSGPLGAAFAFATLVAAFFVGLALG